MGIDDRIAVDEIALVQRVREGRAAGVAAPVIAVVDIKVVVLGLYDREIDRRVLAIDPADDLGIDFFQRLEIHRDRRVDILSRFSRLFFLRGGGNRGRRRGRRILRCIVVHSRPVETVVHNILVLDRQHNASADEEYTGQEDHQDPADRVSLFHLFSSFCAVSSLPFAAARAYSLDPSTRSSRPLSASVPSASFPSGTA